MPKKKKKMSSIVKRLRFHIRLLAISMGIVPVARNVIATAISLYVYLPHSCFASSYSTTYYYHYFLVLPAVFWVKVQQKGKQIRTLFAKVK